MAFRVGSFPLYDTIALFSQQRNEKDEKMFNRRRRCSRHDGCHYRRQEMEIRLFYLKKTKSLERSCLLQERAVVILRMQAIPRIFLTVSSPIASFYTARSTAFPIMIQWAFLMNWGWRLKLNAATAYSRNQTIPQMSSAHYSVR